MSPAEARPTEKSAQDAGQEARSQTWSAAIHGGEQHRSAARPAPKRWCRANQRAQAPSSGSRSTRPSACTKAAEKRQQPSTKRDCLRMAVLLRLLVRPLPPCLGCVTLNTVGVPNDTL